MDELAKALADAIRAGSAAAGPAIHSYFIKIWDDVLSYVIPCTAWVTCVSVICYVAIRVDRLEHDRKMADRALERSLRERK